jgi:tRNA (cmo5U34)-methyltransferase
MKDELYKKPLEKVEKFEFSRDVVNVFDDMISRSVPQYELNQMMTAEMALEFYQENTEFYDLGCSTGKTAKILDKTFGNQNFNYTGIDNSAPMIEECKKIQSLVSENHRLQFICGDIENFTYTNAGVVIANYTFQFIQPDHRLPLLKNIYNSLKNKGVLLLCEKVYENDSELSDHFIKMHHKMKKSYGYSELEIIQKRDAIENVLVPNETLENLDLLKTAGFDSAAIYHKWYNFASYIAFKK